MSSYQSIAVYIALSFTLFSCIFTAIQIRSHLRHNNTPRLRRYVIRILLMTPIYAVASLFGLMFGLKYQLASICFDVLRECYEAFVIYSFYQLLVQFLGGDHHIMVLLAGKRDQKHSLPFCCLPVWQMIDNRQAAPAEFKARVREFANKRTERRRLERSAAESTPNSPPSEVGAIYVSESNTTPLLPQTPTTTVHCDVATAADGTADSVTATAAVVTDGNNNNTNKRPTVQVVAKTMTHQYVQKPFSAVSSPFSPSAANKTRSGLAAESDWIADSPFLRCTMAGTLQYCVLKLIMAVATFILELTDHYGAGEFNWSDGYPYISLVTNASQIWAIYCLVLFYVALKQDLAPIKPVPKFIVVKAIVFATWWQSIIFAGLQAVGVIHDTDNFDNQSISAALQDFVVCIEMSIAALATYYTFKPDDFFDPTQPDIQAPMFSVLYEAMDVSDVYVTDVKKIAPPRRGSSSKRNSPDASSALRPPSPSPSPSLPRAPSPVPFNEDAVAHKYNELGERIASYHQHDTLDIPTVATNDYR